MSREENNKGDFVMGRKFDINDMTDHFYVDASIIVNEIYELFVKKSDLPEEYGKIVFEELTKLILNEEYAKYIKKWKDR